MQPTELTVFLRVKVFLYSSLLWINQVAGTTACQRSLYHFRGIAATAPVSNTHAFQNETFEPSLN